MKRGILLVLGVMLTTLGFVGEANRTLVLAQTAPQFFGGAWGAIGVAILFMIGSGVFAACETAISMLRPMHVKHLREKNAKQGDRLQSFIDRQHDIIAACTLGKDMMRLLMVLPTMALAPGIATVISRNFGLEEGGYGSLILGGFLLLLFVIGPLTMIFEQGLRAYAGAHPHGATYRLRGLIQTTSIAFGPAARLTTAFARLISARVNQIAPPMANVAEEEIKTIVDSAEMTGELEEEERELLHSVFEFGDTVAREVMTPRVDLDAAPMDIEPVELLAMIRDSGHSRIPLYEGTDDQIVGVVHVKDLAMAMLGSDPVNLRTLMRQPLFVPENKELQALLTEMRQHRSELAIVQDEYGGTAGIVTSEDIVEELVGEIVDEYDDEEPAFVELEEGWSVDGRTHLDDVNDELDSEFQSEEFDTIGGFVFGAFGRQPKVGEEIQIDGWRFVVTKTDGRRLERMTLVKAPVEVTEIAEA